MDGDHLELKDSNIIWCLKIILFVSPQYGLPTFFSHLLHIQCMVVIVRYLPYCPPAKAKLDLVQISIHKPKEVKPMAEILCTIRTS